jgi:arsenate reductase
MITIYHNPACSKSRAALDITEQYAQQHHLSLQVIEYLKAPLNLTELRALQQQLGAQSTELVREHNGLTPEQQCQILLDQPELMQRPIIRFNDKAVIARPTEVIHTLLA